METMKCIRKQSVDESLADQCLNAHNYYRCLHGATPLTYDVRLEKTAERYAKKLAQNGVLQPSVAGKRGITNFLLVETWFLQIWYAWQATNKLRWKYLESKFYKCKSSLTSFKCNYVCNLLLTSKTIWHTLVSLHLITNNYFLLFKKEFVNHCKWRTLRVTNV